MKLAVVILNWNRIAATLESVKALAGWTEIAPAIWVVDNSARDLSANAIAQHCPAAQVLSSAVNLGFAGGNNLALRQIAETSAEAVLLLNNDAQIDEDQVQELLRELAAHPRLGIVGPLLKERNGGGQMMITAGGREIAWHLGTRRRCPQPELPALIITHQLLDVLYVPGTVALVRLEAFRRAGFFDEDYFFSGEMADFCRRARALGFASAVCTRAWATHTPGKDNIRSTLYRYYALRNRFLYVRKFYSGWRGICPSRRLLLACFWSGIALAMAAWLLVRGRWAETRAACLALRDGVAGRFGNRNALFGV
ncbi:MAG: glycosyltransferase family 2 protein [Lentisphaerae bacterium]|nr:glycosyltransferase family 2 protein [Lentisphaerota bacterium]